MSITQALCNTAKQQFLSGSHTPSHTYKIALFTSAVTLGAGTTVYSSTNEVVGTGYIAGGQILSAWSSSMDTNVAFLTFTSNPSWASATITSRGAQIYNTSGSQSVAVLDFTTDYSSTNGTFLVQLPAATSTTALIRFT